MQNVFLLFEIFEKQKHLSRLLGLPSKPNPELSAVSFQTKLPKLEIHKLPFFLIDY
jgi:hypothetical protein